MHAGKIRFLQDPLPPRSLKAGEANFVFANAALIGVLCSESRFQLSSIPIF